MSDRITIRQVRPEDVETLYRICLATGNAGADAALLYQDPQMIGHIYVAPYAVLEPGLAVVLEDAEGVAGFSVGTVDTPSWEDRLEREWWPALRSRYDDPDPSDRSFWTGDQQRAAMIHHPGRTPFALVRDYPAHLHLNLMPRAQGKGLGRALFESWRLVAIEHGVKAVHVGVNRANRRGLGFWGNVGFRPLQLVGADTTRTVWMGQNLGQRDVAGAG